MKTLLVVLAIFLTAHAASIAPLAWNKDPLLTSGNFLFIQANTRLCTSHIVVR